MPQEVQSQVLSLRADRLQVVEELLCRCRILRVDYYHNVVKLLVERLQELHDFFCGSADREPQHFPPDFVVSPGTLGERADGQAAERRVRTLDNFN